MSILVMKFGGASVGTVSALTQVLSIVLHEREHWGQLVLVASALDGVTDMLYEAAHLAQVSNQRGYRRIAATLRTRHLSLVEQLPLGTVEQQALQADVDQLLFEMLDICQNVANQPSDTLSAEITDSIVGVGERLSARIIAALLRQNNLRGVAVDATDIIITDDTHGNATPDFRITRERIQQNLTPMLQREIIPVITGFIASTQGKKLTTLGRGGSDYTASIISACIDANEVWMWSDVDGMMSADPRLLHDARVIPELTYNEVAELAYFGARILHAKMIQPIREKAIPLRIKNIYKPQQHGTLVHDIEPEDRTQLKAATSIQGLGFSADQSGSTTNIIQLVDNVLFERIGNHVDVMISSQSSSRSFLCFVIPTSAGEEVIDALVSRLRADLQKSSNTNGKWIVEPMSIITLIGENLGNHAGVVARALQSIDGVPIRAMAQGPSNCSLSIVVETQHAQKLLACFHDDILKSG